MNKKRQLNSGYCVFTTLFCVAIITLAPQLSEAQSNSKGGRGDDVFTGTIFFFPGPTVGGQGRTSMTSRTFSLTLDCTTPREVVGRLAGILKSDGQDGLL